jgi:glycosyltransferase involved in cell wall biosynthesis
LAFSLTFHGEVAIYIYNEALWAKVLGLIMSPTNSDKVCLSIVLPAYNEEPSVGRVVASLVEMFPDAEVLVVDDCSTDRTGNVALQAGAKVIQHKYNMGNGASIKTGARHAKGDVLVFMDADGQHDPADIDRLLEKLDEGYDLVIGARDAGSQVSIARRIGNNIYNKIASIMTGYPILDLTSGFRAVRANHFKRFLYLLPNGFSYPTTSTMAFLRSGLPIAFVPIKAARREGLSHIRPFHDGARFFLIILKIGALFSPMRFFLPISFMLFSLGASYYGYTFFSSGRFTNMSALLFISSLLTFLIGMLSEQISSLHYKQAENEGDVISKE